MGMSDIRTGGKGVAAALTPPQSKKAATVDMKGAVQAAMTFAKDMFPQAKDIRLEEVEPRSGGWSVVVSFTTGEPGTLAQVIGGAVPRLFKTIAIASEGGQAISLKVWKQ
jgi:hypothetical protein